ncbi:DUF421 domain-containing protein [Lujinxingia vulgaris]|nr:YetF domain-containing protein [Lujinxingia vulgaris]
MQVDWIVAPLSDIAMVPISATALFIAVIIFTRWGGLRSFSKLSAFDFALTVAIGSLISSSLVTKDPPVMQALVGMASIFVLQTLTAGLRRRFNLSPLIDNEPIILVHNGEVLHENMRTSLLTLDDLRSKLRSAGVLDLAQVKAVVLETTGDVSVIASSQPDATLDPWLLEGVRGADQPAPQRIAKPEPTE